MRAKCDEYAPGEVIDPLLHPTIKNVAAVQGDVSRLTDLDRLYATVKQQHGCIDIVFANAGIGEFAPLGEISEAHFDKTFNMREAQDVSM